MIRMIPLMFVLVGLLPVCAQPQEWESTPKLANGVYAVQRESLNRNDLLPLKDGEVMAVHNHRYLKNEKDTPPRFFVVKEGRDVALDLAEPPKPIKQGNAVTGMHLKLRSEAAAALERLTREHLAHQLVIIIGGEVVTMHTVREAIRGGDVQVTTCEAGAAKFLLEQLEVSQKRR
jgi:preprotein translocase subunit SecD